MRYGEWAAFSVGTGKVLTRSGAASRKPSHVVSASPLVLDAVPLRWGVEKWGEGAARPHRGDHEAPLAVGDRTRQALALTTEGSAVVLKRHGLATVETRYFVHGDRLSTACVDVEGRLVDYDDEAADTWLRYLGNGYPQPVEAAWLELDEMGRSLGPKKMRD